MQQQKQQSLTSQYTKRNGEMRKVKVDEKLPGTELHVNETKSLFLILHFYINCC